MPAKPLPIIAPREGRARRLDAPMLVAAASELLDRDGLEGLTLASLASAAGVKPPSLYAHFGSLQELRSKVAAFGLLELEQELARSASGKSGAEAIRTICLAYRRYAKRRPGVYAATVAWTGAGHAEVELAGEALKTTVLQILSPSPESMRHAEKIHLLRMMRISMHGFVALEAARSFGEPVDPEETFQRLVNLLIDLVAARSKKQPTARR
jgi:AcrR family transcriptional regulator